MALRKFIVERDIPDAKRAKPRHPAANADVAMRGLDPDIQWIESYVAADKTYSVYLARDEETIKAHAEIGGFPRQKLPKSTR